MKKKRIYISLDPKALNVLEQMAKDKDTTKSLILEGYLNRVKNKFNKKQGEVKSWAKLL